MLHLVSKHLVLNDFWAIGSKLLAFRLRNFVWMDWIVESL